MDHDKNSQSNNKNNGEENIPVQKEGCLSNRKRKLILISIIISLIIIVTVTLLTVFIFIKKEKITTNTTTSINKDATDATTTTTTAISAEACVLHSQSCWSQSANTVAGSFSGGSGSSLSELNNPIAMYYDQPNKVIVVGDSDNQRVLKFFLDNPSLGGTVIAGGNGGGCDPNQFYNTVGLALDSSRQLYVSDSACRRILIFPPNSDSTTFASSIIDLNIPEGIYIDPLTDDLYIAIHGDHSVLKFAKGSTTGVIVAGGNGVGDALNQLKEPNSVYFDYLYTNSLYVVDTGNNRILKFPSGSTRATIGTMVAGSSSSGSGSNQLDYPRYLVVDCNGILYITDSHNYRVQRWLPGASSGDTILGGTQDTTSNQFGVTETILFDENNNLLVVDRGNHRIQLFNITVC